jgi:hypothetical protein
MLAREESFYNNEFMDTVKTDLPKNSWSVIKDCTETVATIRSQLWSGYYAFHRSSTNHFGGIYIGYGLKNLDLPFMI